MQLSDLEFRIPGDCLDTFVNVIMGEYKAPVNIGGPVTVLDIGANCGAFALWARDQWPRCKLFCYEPHPVMFAYLERNTAHFDNILRFNTAVGDTSRNTLYECRGSRTCGSQYQADNKTGSIDISVIAPSTLPVADIIKIDTEGAEYDILQGLCFTPRYLLIEWHSELDRVNIDRWAYARGMMLVKALVHERHVGVNHYVKEEAI